MNTKDNLNDIINCPVVIYQMGKVGSKTIVATLKAAGLQNPIYPVHFLSPSQIEKVERCYVKWGKPASLNYSRKVYSIINEARKNSRIKIITLVRDYIGREISDYFTKIRWLGSDVTSDNKKTTISVDMISDDLRKIISSFDPANNYARTWFDNELKDVFGFDIFEYPFNKEKGYRIYSTENADILCIRLEDLTSCFRQAFKEFMSIDVHKLINKNEATSKESYVELYRQVLSEFKLAEPLLEKIYSSCLMTHFYDNDKIEQFKNRWRQNPVIPESGFKGPGRILIVHSEGNVNNNPNLSGLVEILCENGYAVDIASPRRRNITQTSPHPRARMLLTDSEQTPVAGEFVLLAGKSLSTPQQIAQAVGAIDNYEFVFGVDRAIVEASIIAAAKAIPYGLISYEIFFAEETGADYKQPEILACRNIAFAVCQDPVRGGYLSRENQIPLEKMIYIPVAGRGCVQRRKSFALHDKLGIDYSKNIAICCGSVGAYCMTDELIQSVSAWPDNWVLVIHNRYGLDRAMRSYYQKYIDSKKVFFSTEAVETPARMHTLLNSADIGLAFYRPVPNNKWQGNNIRHIGLASGKISTYLQHGLPVLINEQEVISDYIRQYDCGYVHDQSMPVSIPAANESLQRWSRNAYRLFAEHLDLNEKSKLLLDRLSRVLHTAQNQVHKTHPAEAIQSAGIKLQGADFREFTYSRRSHFKYFEGYDVELRGKPVDPNTADLKRYQDLLVFAFIKNHIPKGSRILDVGGANSRILKYFYKDYECWNIDKLEGMGNGLKSLDIRGRYRLVRDYMGNFNKELPDNYFDFVFSISALEHTPKRDQKSLIDIRDDINRVLKPGGYSLHCFDVIIKKDTVWSNPLLPLFFETQQTLNQWIPLESLRYDPDLYVLSESTYTKTWKKTCIKPYEEFGMPLSYNVLWQKALVSSTADKNTVVDSCNSGSLPVLIYQMGKVGSSTIKHSLDRLNIANEHIHFLTSKGFKDLEQYYQENPQRKVSSHVQAGRKIRLYMDTHPHTRWKVISLVRDPVARTISSYFQNYVQAVCAKMQPLPQDQIADYLVRYQQEHFGVYQENKDPACVWFDQEIKEVFDFDIFIQPFDAEKGYQIYHCPRADILVLQLEKLNDSAAMAFRDFLGIENIQLVRKNTTKEKEYHQLYNMFLDKFKLSMPVLDRVYNTRFVRHFYTAAQIQKFREKWREPQSNDASADLVNHSILDCPDTFTWSRLSHFAYFRARKYDIEFSGKVIDPAGCNLKEYQDLLIYAFIKENIPKGSRILDVGGGNSRIIKHFYKDYECWNIDKLEGLGSGPASLDPANKYKLVRDYMGNFNRELPDNYFDFVFSISALEHVPEKDPQFHASVRDDINRVLKPGGYSFHCFDVVMKKDSVWTNPLLPLLFKTQSTVNQWKPLESLRSDPDLFVLPESTYNQRWRKITKQTYEEFGKPLSYNVLWQKLPVTLPATEKEPVDQLNPNCLPVLIYQMGKVGSATVKSSLDHLSLANEHIHFLTDEGMESLEQYYKQKPGRKIARHVFASQKIRLFMRQHPQVRWKVISLVRDPLSQMISAYFQNSTSELCGQLQSSSPDQVVDCLVRYHKDRLAAFDENRDQTCTWFDREIKKVFDFDVFSQPFDAQKGYRVYRCPRVDILVLQLEQLDICASAAFREFLGIENFRLQKKNTAEEKNYHEVYDLFLKKFKLDDTVLDSVYTTRFVRHFYTDEQIQKFREKWHKVPVVSDNISIAPMTVFCAAGEYPRITVVTPSYNQGAFLEAHIQSILGQNYPNLEYIIMDGGSTDGSVDIIKKYEKQLAYWQSCPDGGQYKAVEAGFRRSTGQILTWLNSDDILRPGALFKVAAVFSGRPEIQWLTGRPNTIHADGSERSVRDIIPWSRERYLRKQYRPYIQQEGTFWTRTLWEKAGAYMHPDYQMAGDLELWVRFFRHTQLYAVDTLLGAFRHQPAQKTKRIIDQYYAEADKALDAEIAFYNQSADKTLLPAPQPISAEQFNQLMTSFAAAVGEKSSVAPAAKSPQPASILLATSLAPNNIENQQRAVQSWLDCGFDVISVNNPDEIQTLAPYFGRVQFVPVSRNGRELYGKPLVYIDDILTSLKSSGRQVVGIINSDIHLRIDASLREKLRQEAVGSMVYARRVNVEHLDDPNGQQSIKGIDLYVMDQSVLEKMPSSRFCLGTSWWDCYLPLFCATTGIPLKWLDGRFAFHIKHELNWNREQWVQTAEHLFDCMYRMSLDKSEASLLSEMEKQWLAYRTFYHCLRQGIIVRRHNKQTYLGSRCVHQLISDATRIIECETAQAVIHSNVQSSSFAPVSPTTRVSEIEENDEQSSAALNDDESAAVFQRKNTMVEALRFFRSAQDAFAVGNMVSARRFMYQYQLSMDYSLIPVIDRREEPSKPLISVIISPGRNIDGLPELLNCLASQSVDDFETIVIDDGNQNIPSVAQKVDCVVQSLVEANATEGRNIGVHFARGQVAVFLDADAKIRSDYLEAVLKAFGTHDIFGLSGRILPACGTQSSSMAAYDRGENPFPTLCNQQRNVAFLVQAWRIVCGADPVLSGQEGADLSWRIMQAFARGNGVIYWPKAAAYYDSEDAPKTREYETQCRNIRNYLLYKYDCSIYSARNVIEKLQIKEGDSLSDEQPLFAANAVQWRSLCYTGNTSKVEAVSSPKVSIVISCFNATDYLRECLDSIQAQTLTDWEAIIVDDGSTDDTQQILKEYAAKDSRFIIYLNTDNQGPYLRRNFAISRTRAPFIAIHDADDIMAPQRLEYLLDEILKDDQLAIVGSFYGWFLGTFKGIECCDIIPISVTHAEIMNTFARTHYICCHAAAIIRKTFLDCIGPYDQQPWGADTFWLAKAGTYSQLTGQVRFKNIPECLSFIRKHGNSQTGKINPNDPRSRRQYLARYYQEKLQRIAEKSGQMPGLDVGAELRQCSCRDFIPQYGHLFSQWESIPVTPDMLRSKLNRAVEEFSRCSYVKAAMFCDTLRQMSPGIHRTFKGFNLIRGLSYFACGDDTGAKQYLEQEYEDHKTVQALRFVQLYMNNGQSFTGRQRRQTVDRYVFAYPEITNPSTQIVYDNRDPKTPRVSIIVDCRYQQTDFGDLVNMWSAQNNCDFELILINSQSRSSDFASLPGLPIRVTVINTDDPVSTAAAKNIAVANSRGDILLFVSSQVTVDNRLLQCLADQMSDHKVSAIRGRITASQDVILCPEYDLGEQPLFCSTDMDLLCAVRKEVFEQIGSLDTGLFDNDLLYLSARIYGDDGPHFEPVVYEPRYQALLRQDVSTSNYLIRTLAKEQMFWRLSTPAEYPTFLSFTESEYGPNGGWLVLPGIQFDFRRRFPAVVREWMQRVLRRMPDSANACYLLADLEWEAGQHEQSAKLYEQFLHSSLIEPISQRLLDNKERETWKVAVEFYTQSCLRLIEYYVLRINMDNAVNISRHVLSNKNLNISPQTAGWIRNLLQSSKSLYPAGIAGPNQDINEPEALVNKAVK